MKLKKLKINPPTQPGGCLLQWHRASLARGRGWSTSHTADGLASHLEETEEVDLLSAILSWDPVSMSWQEAGRLAVPRADHAAVAVSHEVVTAYCQV